MKAEHDADIESKVMQDKKVMDALGMIVNTKAFGVSKIATLEHASPTLVCGMETLVGENEVEEKF